MSQSKLRQVLTVFQTATGPLSLPQIARDLEVTPERLDVMIQHWVRKGRIRESGSVTECGSCGHSGSCAFVMEMPRTYELATDDGMIPLHAIGSCRCRIELEE
jgi:hypothetical protein